MTTKLSAATAAIPFAALLLSACVSEKAYEAQTQQLQQTQARAAAEQAEIAKMQQQDKFVVAGDLLFPEGGYQLSPNGQAALRQYVPQLQALRNAKIVVYGYTDNLPVGPELRGQGIPDNLVLSTRRAASVVTYLVSQGINPNIISAKGVGDTR